MAELSYEQLFDTLRREKSRDELQELPDRFYGHAQRYLRSVEPRGDDQSHRAQKARIELQNARRLLRELYDRRERKIITLAMHKTRAENAVIDTAALQQEEREFFDRLVRLLEENRTAVMTQEPAPEEKKEEDARPAEKPAERGVKVRFLSDVPKFVGRDLEQYGPYKPGDVESLPDSVASILVKKGRAEEV